MPRPGIISTTPDLSPGQANYILRRLVSERRIHPSEISRYLADMHQEIGDLEARLAELRAAAGGSASSGAATAVVHRRRPGRPPRPAAAPSAISPEAPPAAPVIRRRRRRAVTPEQLASQKLQGRYLALVRQIPASRRGLYARIAKENGRDAAILAMEDALHK